MQENWKLEFGGQTLGYVRREDSFARLYLIKLVADNVGARSSVL